MPDLVVLPKLPAIPSDVVAILQLEPFNVVKLIHKIQKQFVNPLKGVVPKIHPSSFVENENVN